MRLIGHLEGEAAARTFSDFLLVQGIENEVEQEREGIWAVWIRAEEEIDRAKSLIASFRLNSNDPKFAAALSTARERRQLQEKEQKAYERRMHSRRQLFRPLAQIGFGPLTFGLICISVAVFVKSGFAKNMPAVFALYISDYDTITKGLSRLTNGLPEIKRGEVWRLFTPIFVHFNFLHIFFNMLWLRDLGSMIEARQGTWRFALLVLAFAAVPNLAQYLVSGPGFGGMSGVVFGLIGYIWIRGKFDPGSGLFLHPSTVTMSLIWFFVCLTGVMGAANTVHGTALAMGMAWGYLSSLRYR